MSDFHACKNAAGRLLGCWELSLAKSFFSPQHFTNFHQISWAVQDGADCHRAGVICFTSIFYMTRQSTMSAASSETASDAAILSVRALSHTQMCTAQTHMPVGWCCFGSQCNWQSLCIAMSQIIIRKEKKNFWKDFFLFFLFGCFVQLCDKI